MEDTRIGKSGKYFSGVIYTVGDEAFFKDNLLKHDFLDDINEPDHIYGINIKLITTDQILYSIHVDIIWNKLNHHPCTCILCKDKSYDECSDIIDSFMEMVKARIDVSDLIKKISTFNRKAYEYLGKANVYTDILNETLEFERFKVQTNDGVATEN